jgi:hypothetical protein
VWDTPEQEQVAGGANAGEIGKLKKLVVHWTGGLPNTVYFTERRYQDLQGNPVNDNLQEKSASTVFRGCSDSSPSQTGCEIHQWYYVAPVANGSNFVTSEGTFDWEASLAARVATPGRYELKCQYFNASSGQWIQLTRTRMVNGWNRQMQFTVRDQFSNPIQGVQVNSTLPTVANWGQTDSTGVLIVSMPPGEYRLTFTHPTGNATPVTLFPYTVTSPSAGNSGVVQQPVTMEVNGSNAEDKAALKTTVVNPSGDPIQGAQVTVQGQVLTTGADGTAQFGNLNPGATQVQVAAAGFQTGAVSVSLVRAKTLKAKITMNVGGPPSGALEPDEDSGSQGFWQDLFVPKEATLEKWGAFIEQLKNWGPIGVVNRFWTAWNGHTIGNEQSLCINIGWQLAGEGSPGLNGCIDLRPSIAAPAPPYPDGGRGSIAGTILGTLRQVAGWMTWCLFFFALVKWVRPRLSW